jgi:hypothetical protein
MAPLAAMARAMCGRPITAGPAMAATWSQLMPMPRSASRRTMAWARSTRLSLMRDSSAARSGGGLGRRGRRADARSAGRGGDDPDDGSPGQDAGDGDDEDEDGDFFPSDDDEFDELTMEGLFLPVASLWRVLGAIDDDERLTPLGWWGLPEAMLRVWAPSGGGPGPG